LRNGAGTRPDRPREDTPATAARAAMVSKLFRLSGQERYKPASRRGRGQPGTRAESGTGSSNTAPPAAPAAPAAPVAENPGQAAR